MAFNKIILSKALFTIHFKEHFLSKSHKLTTLILYKIINFNENKF